MSPRRFETGLTLVEVLVTVVLLSVLLIPAMQALHTGIVGAQVHADVSGNHYRLVSRLEELLVEPFESLSGAAIAAGSPTATSSYSDAAGPPDRILVYLSPYDSDNADADNNPFTGTEDDVLWIRVDIEGTIYSLQTITAQGY